MFGIFTAYQVETVFRSVIIEGNSIVANHITPNQYRVVELLREFYHEGHNPTYRELAERGNLNLSYVHYTVQSLAKKGAVKIKRGQRRAIKLSSNWIDRDVYDPKRVYPNARAE